MTSGWEVLEQQTLLDRMPWVRVIMEKVRLEDGQTVIDDFFRIEMGHFAMIFALTGDRRVALMEQYRHALKRKVLELPAGYIPPGEASLDAARRELREEAGLEAEEWHSLGKWMLDANRGCSVAHAYLALNAERTEAPISVDLQEQTVHFYTLPELRAYWLSDECPVVSTAATIGRGLAWLEQRGLA